MGFGDWAQSPIPIILLYKNAILKKKMKLMENNLYEENYNNENEDKEIDYLFELIFTMKNILLQIKAIFIISIIIFNVFYQTMSYHLI